MKRVAIIGDAHVAAYALARGAIEVAFPSLRLSFFAYANAPAEPPISKEGVLSLCEPAANGAQSQIDLGAHDHVLLVGQRFGLEALARIVREFDILGLRGLGRERHVSLPFLAETLHHRVGCACSHISSFIHHTDKCVVAPMPFVSEVAAEIDSDAVTCARHPASATLMSMWVKFIKEHMAYVKCGLMLQPKALQTRHYRTPEHYTLAFHRAQAAAPADFTHMNAEYGLAHFKAYATDWLGLLPMAHTHR